VNELQPIEFVGFPTQHSSIVNVNGRVERARLPADTVGSRFARCEIDRSGELMFGDMEYEDEVSVLDFAINRFRERGEIAVLDAGCGTARTLFEIKEQLKLRGNAIPEKILTVGVDKDDYSDESQDAEVRAAISRGDIEYVIGDLESVNLGERQFDLITSYEALIHNRPPKATGIIKNLLTYLKDDGIFIFNLEPWQREYLEMEVFLGYWLKQNHYTYSEYQLDSPMDRVSRTFIRISRSTNS
jgi:SAM-dependent methyltransferase